MSLADEITINHLREKIRITADQLIATNRALLLNLNPSRGTQLEALAQELETRLRRTEQELVDRYTAQQRPNTQLVLTALEQDKVAPEDAQQLIAALQTSIRTAEAAGKLENTSLGESVRQAKEVFDDSKLDFKHKLKAGIPLIPGFLSYEFELGVGSGVSLTTIWENLVNRFRGSQPPQDPP